MSDDQAGQSPSGAKRDQEPPGAQGGPWFAFFREVGIIAQLSQAMFEARLSQGVTLRHFMVLDHMIRLGDGWTPLRLARAFQIPKNSMTHTLAGLVDRKFVTIRPHPEDGRSKVVFLTDEGRQFHAATLARLVHDMGAFAEAFPASEIAPLTEQLAKIRAWLDAARSTPGETPGT